MLMCISIVTLFAKPKLTDLECKVDSGGSQGRLSETNILLKNHFKNVILITLYLIHITLIFYMGKLGKFDLK